MTTNLTEDEFKNKIFNFEILKDDEKANWKFEGNKPAIIDFYADWCGPCKMVAPILEELSNEYADKLNIYKVDTEVEQSLSTMFGIRSIPSMLFIPMKGQPKMQAGSMTKATLIKIIENDLLNV